MKKSFLLALVCALLFSSCSSYHKVATWYKYRNDFKLPKPTAQPSSGIARHATVPLTAAPEAQTTQNEGETAPATASAAKTFIASKAKAVKAAIRENGKERRNRIAQLKNWTNLKVNPDQANQYADMPVARKQPPFAVAGFVLGLIGLLIFGIILGLLGIIFSGIALGKVSKSPTMYKKGLAIAGLIISIIAFLGAIILLATL